MVESKDSEDTELIKLRARSFYICVLFVGLSFGQLVSRSVGQKNVKDSVSDNILDFF